MFRHFFIIGSILLFALSACGGLENITGESTTNSTQSINAEQREVTYGAEDAEEVESTDSTTTERAIEGTGSAPQSEASDVTEPVATDSDSDTITEESSEESTNEEPGYEYAVPGY